ncbi:MAG: phosphotransferase [SAR202 cluster bacterium]|nr:phosphotransferase [SAR202 cluster bacterium]
MGQAQLQFDDLAHRAMAEYDIDEYALSFIRHSDNVTFKIDGPGSDAYLLRIHIPVSSAMGAHGADVNAVNSELQWLEALSRDTDLVLQRPVRNRAGTLVTQIATGAVGPVNSTLLRWVEGRPYHRDLETEHTARQIGETLAKLHIQASEWVVPEGFTRPRRNVDYFEGVLAGLRPALDDGRISAADNSEFETSIAILTDALRSLDESRQTHGITYSDSHKGNIILDEGNVRFIDFSFCAFGNFMFDLAIAMSDMKPRLHEAFLKGYRRLRDLPDGHQQLIEGFFVGGMIGTFSDWVANPNMQEALAERVPGIARDYAAKYNRGERFWFS